MSQGIPQETAALIQEMLVQSGRFVIDVARKVGASDDQLREILGQGSYRVFAYADQVCGVNDNPAPTKGQDEDDGA